MRYSPEKKEQARQLYREGMPRREISEKMGIPLSTINLWTAHTLSEPLSFINCEFCDKKKRVSRLPAKYCSERCKKRAQYRRKKRQKQSSL